MEDLTRAFVAVPCGEQLARALSRRLDAADSRLRVRWTPPGAWHLTLQFLGDWPSGRLSALAEMLAPLAEAEPVTLAPTGLGGFPDLRHPRVLFLQFTGTEALVDLALAVRRKTVALWPDGPQDTRPVQPHLTLARARQPLEPWQVNMLPAIDLVDLPTMTCERFCLMASRLGAAGARHTELASFALRKKGE